MAIEVNCLYSFIFLDYCSKWVYEIGECDFWTTSNAFSLTKIVRLHKVPKFLC